MRSAHTCLFTLVAVLSLAHGARAEPGAVLVGGTASARQQVIASGAVTTLVRTAGWIVGDRTYSAADAMAAAACLRRPDPWRCLSAILRDEQIRRVAVVSVDPKPGKAGATDTVITERLVISNIDSLFVAQRFCARCTERKLAELAAELTKELLDRAAVGSGRTVLAIRSAPRGARAYVDANLIGVTDTSINVVPGTHTITVELDEHRTGTRQIRVEENTTQEVAFSLPASRSGRSQAPLRRDDIARDDPVPPVSSGTRRRSHLVPGAIAGTGLAVLAAGIVLFALDEDPVTHPDEDASRRHRDTAARGIAIGASGLAMAGVGGYLWWKYSRARSAPVIAPVNGGAVVGVARSF